MIPEIERFAKWLRRKAPHTSTHIHYTNDMALFFAWAGKLPADIKVTDVDAFIAYCQQQGHGSATVNRRLAAIRCFYHFLDLESDTAPLNPVLPKRHFIRPGQRLARATVEIVAHIRQEVGRVDFWHNLVAQGELRGWLVHYLDMANLVSFARQEALADLLVQVDRARHTTLVDG
jgi:hypothetical protein